MTTKKKSGSGSRTTGSVPGTSRELTVKVKTAKRRKLSSTLWLQRQLNEARGDLPRAAEALGLTVRTLAQRLRDHGISLEDGEGPLPRKAP